jgi:uncharacterized protein
MTEPPVRVVDHPASSRYELRVGERLAGHADYEVLPDGIILTHTEIDPAYRGRGLANRLAADTLDDIRRRHLRVTPRCPFMARYIRTHPEYADLVAPPAGTGA